MKPVSTENKMRTDERETTPNTLFLAFNQTSLRLRHLTQIIGYNLASPPDGKPFHSNPLPSALPHPTAKNGYYFTLQASAEERPEYVSDLQSSNCPAWESFDCGTVFPVHLRSQKGIVIRVRLRQEKEEIPVTSWGVNFSGLVPVSSKTSSASDYAPNTLLFKLRGRYYTSYDNLRTRVEVKENSLVDLHHGVSLSHSETKPSYSVPFLSRLHSNKRVQRRLECKRENLRESLEAKGVKNESRRTNLHKEIENLKIKICLLMEQLEIEMNKLRAIKLAADNQDSENQDKGIELLEGYQALNKYLGSLRTQEIKLHEENELLKDIVSKMKERRCHLLSQLPFVFPVQKSLDEDVKYTICGIGLPDAESYEGFSDQSLSVSLGHVAQLLVKIAFLVNIPLKYPITLRGSLSSIADLTSTQLSDVETQFPLYTRGKEKEKLHFNYGVFLLNKNIAQLRWSCGLPTSDLRPTLQNVWSFLCSLQDKNSPPPRAFMPDTVVPPIILPASLRQAVQTPTTLLQHQTPRLPLNISNSQPRILKSLPDTPSSPKLKIPKKSSLEEDYFLATTSSDVESKMERQESDEDHSDVDGTSFRVCSPRRRHFSARKYELQKCTIQHVSKLRPTSFSLDQGLNYIKEGEREADSLRERSLKTFQFTNFASLASGSFPNLTSKGTGERATSSAEEAPLSNLNEQTTQLLQSWHENDPSPYHSIVTGSSSSEKLESVDRREGLLSSEKTQSPEVCELKTSTNCQDEANGHRSPVSTRGVSHQDEIMNCVNTKLTETVEKRSVTNESRHDNGDDDKEPPANHLHQTPIEKNSGEASEVESFQRRLVKEMGLSLSDFSLEEDDFLHDVASRTANLASHNCSFKLSFSRQSTQE